MGESMITWTTPTIPVTITTGQLEKTHCKVYMTVTQGQNSVTLEPYRIESDEENDRSVLMFYLAQLQTGNFHPGEASVQVNFIDWMGYRDATKFERIYLGSNLIGKELVNKWPKA